MRNLKPDLDIQKLSEAFDDYMFKFGFKPIGEDRRGKLRWAYDEATPVLEAIRFEVEDSPPNIVIH